MLSKSTYDTSCGKTVRDKKVTSVWIPVSYTHLDVYKRQVNKYLLNNVLVTHILIVSLLLIQDDSLLPIIVNSTSIHLLYFVLLTILISCNALSFIFVHALEEHTGIHYPMYKIPIEHFGFFMINGTGEGWTQAVVYPELHSTCLLYTSRCV